MRHRITARLYHDGCFRGGDFPAGDRGARGRQLRGAEGYCRPVGGPPGTLVVRRTRAPEHDRARLQIDAASLQCRFMRTGKKEYLRTGGRDVDIGRPGEIFTPGLKPQRVQIDLQELCIECSTFGYATLHVSRTYRMLIL